MKRKREVPVADYLTDTLLQLMEKRAYQKISITDLCEQAGVARVSFYRNFQSKDDILVKKIEKTTETFMERTPISYKDDPPNVYFVKLMSHMHAQRKMCDLLQKAGKLYLINDEFDRVFQTVYAGRYDPYVSHFISGGIYNVFYHWLRSGWKETPAELAEKLAGIPKI